MAKKQKLPYSLGSNVLFTARLHWRVKPLLVINCVVAVLLGVATPFLGILLPKVVLDALEAQVAPGRFVLVVGVLVLAQMLAGYVLARTQTSPELTMGSVASFDSIFAILKRQILMDYEQMLDPAVKELGEKAYKATYSNHAPAHNVLRATVRLLTNALGFLLYAAVIARLHPLLLVALLGCAAVSWFLLAWPRRYEAKTRGERARWEEKLHNLSQRMRQRELGKDCRLYGMNDWLRAFYRTVHRSAERESDKVAKRYMGQMLLDALLILLRDGAAYALLIVMLLRGDIALGDFVFIFAAIGALAGWMSGALVEFSELLRGHTELCDRRAYTELPPRTRQEGGVPVPTGPQPPSMTLERVSYRYPETEQDILREVDLHIRSGERIAVVGPNGAGKTTMIMLLCGLLSPTDGTVRLNGTDIRDFNRPDYYRLISPVFQEIHLMTADVSYNVSQSTRAETDHDRVRQCLQTAGLWEKVQSLPRREQTPLVWLVDEDAVELSGGELQKLALARALYKDAPVIILDEPTAALDPIAESRVYQQYAELTEGKTSVYISHRLASTRFCDRILFVGEQRILEQGTHDELMALGGRYAEMFSIQSQYYQDATQACDGEEPTE